METLQKDEVHLTLFGKILTGSRDTLRGYKISSIEIDDESFLSRGEEKNQFTAIASDEEDDSIDGTVFEILEEDLLLADKYEPDGFGRVEVELESGKRAWMYQKHEGTTVSAEAGVIPPS